MNTHIFIGYEAPPLEAIPVGCWAEGVFIHKVDACDVTRYMWYMVYPP